MIAAIYARKSTEQNGVADDQKSVVRQVEHARAYAAQKGWTVAPEHIYVDDGISGAEFAGRPGFLRLMNSLKPKPAFQALIMSEESRLGREQIEVSYALKQLVTAGVRVFCYLTDTERTLNSPIEKAMLALSTMADEMERERARQRTYDALRRKAQAGHVTGGRTFGYVNVDVLDASGARSHVDRRINETEATVVRRVFELAEEGHGYRTIAKRLNDEGVASPRAQRGRSKSWAPSSVREVLFRTLYRGEITWNATRKRDRWGQQRQTGRPEAEWLRIPAPHLRIVSDELWQGAHERLDAARALYLRGTKGRVGGRPAAGSSSPYLLTNLGSCACCHGSLRVRTRSHGSRRAKYYGCANYHERGRTVCTNSADIPMEDADAIVIEALLDEVLTPDMMQEAVGRAIERLVDPQQPDRLAHVEEELANVEREQERLINAIAAGGELAGLVDALKAREAQREMAHNSALTLEQAIDDVAQHNPVGQAAMKLYQAMERVDGHTGALDNEESEQVVKGLWYEVLEREADLLVAKSAKPLTQAQALVMAQDRRPDIVEKLMHRCDPAARG